MHESYVYEFLTFKQVIVTRFYQTTESCRKIK